MDDQYGDGPKRYPRTLESRLRPGVEPGLLSEHLLPPGRVYPGAAHRYVVHRRPDAPAGPLPLVIVLDGIWCHLSDQPGATTYAPVVLDNLMAAGEIPQAVTVFVDPGISEPARPTQQARRERAFEYDSLSDRLAAFLFEDLVPAVARIHPLSDAPHERLIIGGSTGAVGAFVAAWHRPDLVQRVVAFVGTFVAMKGADTIAGLVRRSEPKPLKVWLHANRYDHITADQPWGAYSAGSWPAASRTLHDALRFAGYDATLVMGEGGHDFEHAASVLPDALRWIWNDRGPDGSIPPLVIREPAARRGPHWEARASVWSTITAPRDWRRLPISARLHGLAVSADGTVLVRTSDGTLLQPDGREVPGRRDVPPVFALGSDGDLLAVDRAGRLLRGSRNRTEVIVERFAASTLLDAGDGILHGIVGDAVGTVDLASRSVTWSAFAGERPHALGLTPDRAQLLVTDARRRHQWSLLRSATGVPFAPEPFFRMEEMDDLGGATAVTADTTGQVYFATALGIQVCEPIGRTAMILSAPEPTGTISALAFGGPGMHELFALQNGSLHHRPMRTRGTPSGSPVRPPDPEL